MKKQLPIDLYEIRKRLAADDQSALKILYDHYGDQFLQLAMAILRSKEMAEEVVEDVFIQVWKKRQEMLRIENFSFYLYITVKNISISYLRKYSNKKQFSVDDLSLPYYQFDASPEDMMITSEITRQINQAINELPLRCKIIFKLVKEDCLKYREVAELLEVTEKTVENQIGIALKKIHASVKIYLPENFRLPR